MRVIVADDAVLFREGAARGLRDAGFDVIGQAGDPTELLTLVRRDQPDVAIIDIRMPPTRTSGGPVLPVAVGAAWRRDCGRER